MKSTYLVRKKLPDGSTCLSIATLDEWLSIVKANKSLPASQQRYFITDYIADGDDIDRMVIETSAEDYKKWNKDRMSSARNRALGRDYQILPLDVQVSGKNDIMNLIEIASPINQVEADALVLVLMDELKAALAEWQPWATDLLEYYLRGERRTCTEALAQKYGVSPQVIRKYKRQFEEFTKKFLGCVSF